MTNNSNNGANSISQAQSFQITSNQVVNISSEFNLSPGTSVTIGYPSQTILNGITISSGVYKNPTEDVLDILNHAIEYTPLEVGLVGLGSLGEI